MAGISSELTHHGKIEVCQGYRKNEVLSAIVYQGMNVQKLKFFLKLSS